MKDFIISTDYDVHLLQEMWLDGNVHTLQKSLLYSAYFDGLDIQKCASNRDDQWGLKSCSGLMILSRHPIKEIEFKPFSVGGDFLKVSKDGEWWVQKGIGRAQIIINDIKIDLFTTHLISYTTTPEADYKKERYQQTWEAIDEINKSDADIKIFSGDVNHNAHYER